MRTSIYRAGNHINTEDIEVAEDTVVVVDTTNVS